MLCCREAALHPSNAGEHFGKVSAKVLKFFQQNCGLCSLFFGSVDKEDVLIINIGRGYQLGPLIDVLLFVEGLFLSHKYP